MADQAPDGRQPPTIGLRHRELAIVHEALRDRTVDLRGRKRLWSRVEAVTERDGYARQILELDLVRVKRGDDSRNVSGNEEIRT